MHDLKKILRTYSSCIEIPTLLWICFSHIAVCDFQNFSSRVLFTNIFTIHWSFVIYTSAFNLISCVSLFTGAVQADKNKEKNVTIVNIWMWIDHYVTSYIFHLTSSCQDTKNKVFSRFILKVCLGAYSVMTFKYL